MISSLADLSKLFILTTMVIVGNNDNQAELANDSKIPTSTKRHHTVEPPYH